MLAACKIPHAFCCGPAPGPLFAEGETPGATAKSRIRKEERGSASGAQGVLVLVHAAACTSVHPNYSTCLSSPQWRLIG